MSNANALPIEAPNLFSLSGGGLTVSLALSGFDGKPHFSYQDSHQSLNFSGDDIAIEETALGTLVTVILVRTPGCYGLQLDSSVGTTTVVVDARR